MCKILCNIFNKYIMVNKKDSTIHKQWDQIICMWILTLKYTNRTESKDSFQNPLSIKEKNNNWNPVV